jgi:prepilin-type processing-associated H-X9-DG protein
MWQRHAGAFFNAQSLEELRPLQDIWDHGLKSHVSLISDLHAYRDGENAVVTLRLNFLSSAPRLDLPIGSCERLHLRKFGDIWQILPDKKNISKSVGRVPVVEDLLLDNALQIAKPPSLMAEESLQKCQSNLKQIGKAFFSYTQDYDEKWSPFDDWQKQILAYVRDGKVFACSNAKEDDTSYSYNPAFRGATLAAVAAPAQTVLLYEGEDRKFDFRHEVNGVKLTNILFADGHVEAYSQETLDAAMKDRMVQWKLEQ